jgi:type IV secretory pathway VirB3-like protein
MSEGDAVPIPIFPPLVIVNGIILELVFVIAKSPTAAAYNPHLLFVAVLCKYRDATLLFVIANVVSVPEIALNPDVVPIPTFPDGFI